MSPSLIAAYALCVCILAACACVALILGGKRDHRLARRIALARGEVAASPTPQRGATFLIRFVGSIGRGITRSGLLPTGTIAELQEGLAQAGLREPSWLSVFIGAKILLVILCPITVFLVLRGVHVAPVVKDLAPFIAAVIGLVLPDRILSSIQTRYRTALEQGVPDALDLMVICTQAGLGLTATMERVAAELRFSHPHVARELAETVNELQIAVDGATALTALGTRTDLEGFKRLGRTLIQSVQYGTPLSEALRNLAGEMRGEALVRYEEKAARLPVLLTIPMIVLVLPCIFIVVGGPAALLIGKAFHH